MKILLVCGGGYSSGLLASRVKQAAESRGLTDVEVDFSGRVTQELIQGVDVILFGPQIRYILMPNTEFARGLNATGIPYAAIPGPAYGRGDGGAILDQALALVHTKAK